MKTLASFFCGTRRLIWEFESVNTDRETALFHLVKRLEHKNSNADLMCSFEMLVFLQQHKIAYNKQGFIFIFWNSTLCDYKISALVSYI